MPKNTIIRFSHLILYVLVVLATFLMWENPFFWDTIQLASKHAHFFYETGFQSIILPSEIDSGHPPAFGMYLAAVWQIFGKTLIVSHFAMLPFLFGIVFFLLKIGKRLGGEHLAPWLVVLCFADPVLASQAILVSPDVVLACFFLMALCAIWEGRNWWLVVAVMGLGFVSMRGMMLAAGLFVFSIIATGERFSWGAFFKKLPPFVPGGLLAGGFLLYHFLQTGWVGHHVGSTWAGSFERVDFQGFIKNLAVLVWRFLDFGRVFLWLALGFVSWSFWKKKEKMDPEMRGLVLLFFITFLALVPTQLFYKGLLAHRYLLPVFLSLTFVFFSAATSFNKFTKLLKFSKPLLLFAILALASGNLWIYPKKISQGWDSTLAHLPWYTLKKEMTAFLLENKIPFRKVGTAFPNIGSQEMSELNGAVEGFVAKDLNINCFVFYSNIMNDFSDEEIDELEQRWAVVKRLDSGGVCIILYQNPNQKVCEN